MVCRRKAFALAAALQAQPQSGAPEPDHGGKNDKLCSSLGDDGMQVEQAGRWAV